jgi:hypothetical protein
LANLCNSGIDGPGPIPWGSHLSAREARRCLAEVQPDLTERETKGQVVIVDFANWYLNAQGSIRPARWKTP